MACDAALLCAVGRGASPPTLRFYAWDPPAVSLGRHQPAPGPDALRALATRGLVWVRRPTGGRAVYHGPPAEELTYSLIVPLGTPPLEGGVRQVCRRIHAGLAAGLRSLGIEATVAQGARAAPVRPSSRRACFAAAAPGEIAVAGRKLVGSAQRRTRFALLQHGSIPLAGDQEPLAAAWPGSLCRDDFTTIAEAAGRRLAPATVAAALEAGLAATLNVLTVRGVFSDQELEELDARLGSRAPA